MAEIAHEIDGLSAGISAEEELKLNRLRVEYERLAGKPYKRAKYRGATGASPGACVSGGMDGDGNRWSSFYGTPDRPSRIR